MELERGVDRRWLLSPRAAKIENVEPLYRSVSQCKNVWKYECVWMYGCINANLGKGKVKTGTLVARHDGLGGGTCTMHFLLVLGMYWSLLPRPDVKSSIPPPFISRSVA